MTTPRVFTKADFLRAQASLQERLAERGIADIPPFFVLRPPWWSFRARRAYNRLKRMGGEEWKSIA